MRKHALRLKQILAMGLAIATIVTSVPEVALNVNAEEVIVEDVATDANIDETSDESIAKSAENTPGEFIDDSSEFDPSESTTDEALESTPSDISSLGSIKDSISHNLSVNCISTVPATALSDGGIALKSAYVVASSVVPTYSTQKYDYALVINCVLDNSSTIWDDKLRNPAVEGSPETFNPASVTYEITFDDPDAIIQVNESASKSNGLEIPTITKKTDFTEGEKVTNTWYLTITTKPASYNAAAGYLCDINHDQITFKYSDNQTGMVDFTSSSTAHTGAFTLGILDDLYSRLDIDGVTQYKVTSTTNPIMTDWVSRDYIMMIGADPTATECRVTSIEWDTEEITRRGSSVEGYTLANYLHFENTGRDEYGFSHVKLTPYNTWPASLALNNSYTLPCILTAKDECGTGKTYTQKISVTIIPSLLVFDDYDEMVLGNKGASIENGTVINCDSKKTLYYCVDPRIQEDTTMFKGINSERGTHGYTRNGSSNLTITETPGTFSTGGKEYAYLKVEVEPKDYAITSAKQQYIAYANLSDSISTHPYELLSPELYFNFTGYYYAVLYSKENGSKDLNTAWIVPYSIDSFPTGGLDMTLTLPGDGHVSDIYFEDENLGRVGLQDYTKNPATFRLYDVCLRQNPVMVITTTTGSVYKCRFYETYAGGSVISGDSDYLAGIALEENKKYIDKTEVHPTAPGKSREVTLYPFLEESSRNGKYNDPATAVTADFLQYVDTITASVEQQSVTGNDGGDGEGVAWFVNATGTKLQSIEYNASSGQTFSQKLYYGYHTGTAVVTFTYKFKSTEDIPYEIRGMELTGRPLLLKVDKSVPTTTYPVSADKGNYTIGESSNPTALTLNTEVSEDDAYSFYVKAKPGYLIDTVSYKVGTAEAVEISIVEGTKNTGYMYTIPAGTVLEETKIMVTTTQVLDMSKATVTLLWGTDEVDDEGETIYRSKSTVTFNDNLVPDLVRVKIGNTTLEDSEYVYEISDTSNAGIVYVTVYASEYSTNVSGSKVVTYTIKGTKISDTRNILVRYESNKVLWGGFPNIEDRSRGNATFLNELAVYDITYVEDRRNPENDWCQLNEGSDYIVEYSNNYFPGTATATIIGKGAYEGSRDVKFTILNGSFTYENVSLGIDPATELTPPYTYDGKAKKPQVTVNGLFGEGPLVEGVDYTVTYKNNVKSIDNLPYKELPEEVYCDTRKPYVLITGKGYYKGSKAMVNFDINGIYLNEENGIKVTVPSIPFAKNKTLVPNPIVTQTLADGTVKTLKKGADYTVIVNSEEQKFADIEDACAIDFYIEGKGNYTGSMSDLSADIATMSISSGKNKFISKIADKNYTGNPITLSDEELGSLILVKATAEEDEYYLSLGSDYEIVYFNNTNAGTAVARIIGIGEYYGTKDIKFKIISKKSISDEEGESLVVSMNGLAVDPTSTDIVSGWEHDYTGYAVVPTFVIQDNQRMTGETPYELVAGKDYTVKCTANANVGIATAKLTYKGNYSGGFTRTYKINAWSLADAKTIISVEDTVYSGGKALKPAVTVKREISDGENTEYITISPKAFKITYSNNKAVYDCNIYGTSSAITPKVVIKSAKEKNISGNPETRTFSIMKADLSRAVISNISAQAFKGKAVTVKPTVKCNGAKLKEGKDYTVSYVKYVDGPEGSMIPDPENILSNIQKGKAYYSITAVPGGNYTGSTYTTFVIK